MPKLPKTIQKVGVFVSKPIEELVEKVLLFDLQFVQLHGDEDPEYCATLREALNEKSAKTGIIKVFSVNDAFDFTKLSPFETCCEYYLFDTKGPLPGGNGYEFDWKILEKYPSHKPFLLSGGIGLSSKTKLRSFLRSPAATYCYAIDVNSKFETAPGHKDVEAISALKAMLAQ